MLRSCFGRWPAAWALDHFDLIADVAVEALCGIVRLIRRWQALRRGCTWPGGALPVAGRSRAASRCARQRTRAAIHPRLSCQRANRTTAKPPLFNTCLTAVQPCSLHGASCFHAWRCEQGSLRHALAAAGRRRSKFILAHCPIVALCPPARREPQKGVQRRRRARRPAVAHARDRFVAPIDRRAQAAAS